MLSMAGLVLSEKLDVLQLTFYTAPVSCAMLLPFYLIREVQELLTYIPLHTHACITDYLLASIPIAAC